MKLQNILLGVIIVMSLLIGGTLWYKKGRLPHSSEDRNWIWKDEWHVSPQDNQPVQPQVTPPADPSPPQATPPEPRQTQPRQSPPPRRQSGGGGG